MVRGRCFVVHDTIQDYVANRKPMRKYATTPEAVMGESSICVHIVNLRPLKSSYLLFKTRIEAGSIR